MKRAMLQGEGAIRISGALSVETAGDAHETHPRKTVRGYPRLGSPYSMGHAIPAKLPGEGPQTARRPATTTRARGAGMAPFRGQHAQTCDILRHAARPGTPPSGNFAGV